MPTQAFAVVTDRGGPLLHLYEAVDNLSRGSGASLIFFEENDLTPNGSASFRASSTDTNIQYFFRFYSDVDVREARYSKPSSFAAPYVTPQDVQHVPHYEVVRREYLPIVYTATDFIEAVAGDLSDTEHVEASVWIFLDSALQGLQQVHEKGRIHGNLQPDRIGRSSAGQIVLRDIGIRDYHKIRNLRYVAPELRQTPHLATQTSDIFAMLRIATDLLAPFRNDSRHAALAKLDSQFRWLTDYYTPRSDRPSAGDLRYLLAAGRPPSRVHEIDAFFDAFSAAHRNHVPYRPAPDLTAVSGDIETYPETAFAIDGSASGIRLAHWLAIVNPWRDLYPIRGRDPKTDVPKDNELEFENDKLPRHLDARWRTAIHRSMFGVGIDSGHEARMERLGAEAISKHQLFEKMIAGTERARQTLIDDHTFLSTREVLELLEHVEPNLERPEFMVLRRWGYVLAVPDHGRWLHPAFQFRNGAISPLIGDAHRRFRDRLGGRDIDPWSELQYWSLGRDPLDGQSLADVLWQERFRRQVDFVLKNAYL